MRLGYTRNFYTMDQAGKSPWWNRFPLFASRCSPLADRRIYTELEEEQFFHEILTIHSIYSAP